VAVMVYAADLGPERPDGVRQPLYSMDPYDLLAEVHTEQRLGARLPLTPPLLHSLIISSAQLEQPLCIPPCNHTHSRYPPLRCRSR